VREDSAIDIGKRTRKLEKLAGEVADSMKKLAKEAEAALKEIEK
jgi:hypothetical protein